jgi:hypothetical protein
MTHTLPALLELLVEEVCEKKSAMYAEGIAGQKRKELGCAKRVHLGRSEMYTMYAMYTEAEIRDRRLEIRERTGELLSGIRARGLLIGLDASWPGAAAEQALILCTSPLLAQLCGRINR